VAREAEIILAGFESKNAVVPVGVVRLEKITDRGFSERQWGRTRNKR